MQNHTLSPETVKTLSERRNGSLRKLACELGFAPNFAGVLGDILRQRPGHVSLETENRVRIALGLAPIAQYIVIRQPRPPIPAWLRAATEWLRQREHPC